MSLKKPRKKCVLINLRPSSVILLAIFFLTAFTGCQRSSSLSGKYKDHNLVLLVLDTLRADHLSSYGYFRSTSPNLDEFSRNAIKFNNTYAQIPITLPSHASMFTGLYPQNARALRNIDFVPDENLTIAEILKKAGYKTAAVVSTAVLKSNKNLTQGFDKYFENFNLRESEKKWEAKGVAEDANNMAFQWLEQNQGEKFFLFINYYDIHWPYIEQQGFSNKFEKDSDELMFHLEERWTEIPQPQWKVDKITNYDRSLAYTDFHIQQLFQKLEEMNLSRNTILMVTSDHGNGLFQHHDYWSHGNILYKEQVHIPLILKLPDMNKGLEIDRIVEIVDFFPTLLDLLGVKPGNQIDGFSVIPLIEGKDWEKPNLAFSLRKLYDNDNHPLPRQIGVITPETHLILTVNKTGNYFDWLRDPYEKNDLYNSESDYIQSSIAARSRDGLSWLQRNNIKKTTSVPLDEKTLEELRALGYIK